MNNVYEERRKNGVEISRTYLSRILVKIFVVFGQFMFLGSKNVLGTFPHLIWGQILCMHAQPHRRKDQLPLR